MINSALIQYHFVRSHTDNSPEENGAAWREVLFIEAPAAHCAPIEHVDVVVLYDWDVLWLLSVENFSSYCGGSASVCFPANQIPSHSSPAEVHIIHDVNWCVRCAHN